MALDFPSSPTNGQTYTANNITWVYETSSTTWKVKQDGTAGKTRIASVKDIKGPAADGGAIAAETWTTRDLNTISDVGNIGISVSSDSSGTGNYMTVPAGTYKITWRAPGWRIYTFKTILEYSTDSTFATGVTEVIGSSEYSSTVGTDGQNSQSNSVGLVPSVTFTETTYVRIRQWSAVAKSSPDNGLGVATINNLVIPSRDSQENNVFTLVEIEDLATTVKDNATYVEGTSRTAIVKDQKNKGVQGGDFIKDVWRDRDLTVEDDPFNFVTLYPTTNGQTTPSPGNTPGYFSLPTGKYQITFTAVAHDVGKNVAAMIWSSTQSNINKTYAVTDSRDGEFYGTSMACAGASTLSKGSEVVEITETSFFKVIHFCKSSNSGSGFGQAVDIGTPDKETYLIIEIEDLATAVKDNATYVEGTSKVAILKDQKNYTVAGGTFNQNTWVDRDLTVEEDPQNFVNFTAGGSQSSPSPGNTPGYWSLPAGTYKIDWSAVGYMVGNHTCWLVWSTTQSEITTAALNANISAAGDYEEGSAARASASTDESMTDSSGYKVITISQPTYFKLLHRCTDSQTTNGLGRPISQDGVLKNIYTQVRIEDLATAVKEVGGSGIVPVGGIIMYSGTQTELDALINWKLCDGTTYGSVTTPNLKDKFVIGADQYSSGWKTNVTGSLTSDGGDKDAVLIAHSHLSPTYNGLGGSYEPGYQNPTTGYDYGAQAPPTEKTAIDAAGTTTTGASATLTGTNANLPPYFALAYIMRIS